jgi:SpoIID/LytB domain protein
MLTPMRAARRTLAISLVAAALLTLAPAARAATWTFPGRGWGHGLGMGQWGAKGLAEKGWSASQILKHYYRGTAVEKKSLPSTIRVGLLQERAEIWVEADGGFNLYDRTGTRRASGDENGRWRIVPDGDRLEVYAPGKTTPTFTSGVPVTVRYEPNHTAIHLPQTGYDYGHGRIDVDINPSSGKTRAILIVPFEQYLYGLGEMPSSWHTEAIEAQAIAGRTYALEKVLRLGQNRSVCNCGVYATTVDQAYVGLQHELARWVAAVDGTAGLVVTYQDKPIQAFYSSSTGGFTENNENIFGGDPLPYLRGVCDPGDYNGGDNPHANWSVSFSDSEIESRLRDAGYVTGPIQDIDFLSPKGVSGRIIAVKDETHGGVRVEGTIDDARLSGSTFRTLLGLKSNLIAFNIYGAIRNRYDALFCKPGLARSSEYTWRDLDGAARGRAQNFTSGRLFFSSSSGKVVLASGAILAHYDLLRGKGLDLGLPVRDPAAVTGGKMSAFERGDIYWSSGTGAHEVHGSIRRKYVSTGGPKVWGLPTTDELPAPGGRSGRFEKCRIYWSAADGAHPVYGSILRKYVEIGGGNSDLGLPTSDEYSISIGRRQDFQHGYIKWNRDTGATGYRITD